MKRAIYLIIVCLCLAGALPAQNVGVGTNTPDASAKLDISSANSGLLIPRVSLLDVTNGVAPVAAPATGVLVFNTNAAVTGGDGTGFYYWDGAQWVKLVVGSGLSDDWALAGNAGTNPGTDFLGTTDTQPLVIRTDNVEAARVNTNGNVGIGTTSATARLYNYLPATDNTTNYGIRNDNYGSDNAVKYGIYTYTSSDGTGEHYGIRNYTYLNSASNASAYGFRNQTYTYGSAAQYGIYNYLYTTSATGIHYGQRNYIYLNSTSTADAYGTYTFIDVSAGNRYGNFLQMNSNTAYDGDLYGSYHRVYGSGDGLSYGSYNEMDASGTGLKYGTYNEMSGIGLGNSYGVYSNFPAGNLSTKYGMRNEFVDEAGTKYGVYNYFANGTAAGTIYGMYNAILADGPSTKYGAYTQMAGGDGPLNGYYATITPATTNSSAVYGVYGFVSSQGTGVHYGVYGNAYGDGNRGVNGVNTHPTGWAGHFTGNTFMDGEVTINESGDAAHDVRMEGDTRTEAFFLDASQDAVLFGSSAATLTSNGVNVAGVVVDYVADFDNGAASGTAVGIGSIEYLLDGNNHVHINSPFSSVNHLIDDLGFSTTNGAWDDVYADNFVNVSDRREKEGIRDLSYGLDEVMRLRPVSYTLISDPFHEPKLGLIAQEVLPVVGEAVKTHDYRVTDEANPDHFEKVELERMGMKYNQLIPVLINAIQEQQEQIEAMQKEIDALKAGGNEGGN